MKSVGESSSSAKGDPKLPQEPRPTATTDPAPGTPPTLPGKTAAAVALRSLASRGASVRGTSSKSSIPSTAASTVSSVSSQSEFDSTSSSSMDSSSHMKINVGTLMGNIFSITIPPSATVADVKQRIYEDEGIPLESQILLYREKTLLDGMPLGDYGIESGATLQLVLHMAGGPGPLARLNKPVKEEDAVVLLLCRRNDDLYVLEVHIKDGQTPTTIARQITSLIPGTLSSSTSLSDMLLPDSMLERSDSTKSVSVDDGEVTLKKISRPGSSTSHLSTGTLLSMLHAQESHEREWDGLTLSSRGSRPSSGSSDGSTMDLIRSCQDALDDPVTDFLATPATPATSVVSGPKDKLRPATAISVMRLPFECVSMMVTTPKPRPASSSAPSLPRTAGEASDSLVGPLVLEDAHDIQEHPEPILVHNMEPVKEWPAPPIPDFLSLSLIEEGFTAARLPAPQKTQCLPTRPQSRTVKKEKSRVWHGESRPLSRNQILEFHSEPTLNKTSGSPHHRRPLASANKTRRLIHTKGPSRRSTPFVVDGSSSRKERKPMTPSVSASQRTSIHSDTTAVPPQETPSRCHACNKKLGMTLQFQCKCSHYFCAQHRYSDRHQCTFDYKTAGRAALVKENPLIRKDKLYRL